MSITMIMDLYSESLQVGWIQTKSSKFSIHYGVLFICKYDIHELVYAQAYAYEFAIMLLFPNL